MTIKVRIAPSPTGLLHVGNARTALVNWLFARANGGKFVLRMDDTDFERSTEEYARRIEEDMAWLGLAWDEFARQSDRMDRYETAKQKLLADGRLYVCYETQEELEIKRKMMLGRGQPPIYDRAGLKLTGDEKHALESEGRKPHYRFLLKPGTIEWDDLIRGKNTFNADNLSDPILIRAGGVPTYTLSSVVDDGELGITHVIRGEDHVTNTAVQIQLFEALFGVAPKFGHLALLKTKEGKISKREGGFDIADIRAQDIEPMAVNSLLARLGTSQPVEPRRSLAELAESFDFRIFGRAPANYDFEELERVNHKIVAMLDYAEVKPKLAELGIPDVGEGFWLSVRGNLQRISEIKDWWEICREKLHPQIDDPDFTMHAADLLPGGDINDGTWKIWVEEVKNASGRKGKELFMPLRKALTGREDGPELARMLPLIGRERAVARLKGETA